MFGVPRWVLIGGAVLVALWWLARKDQQQSVNPDLTSIRTDEEVKAGAKMQAYREALGSARRSS